MKATNINFTFCAIRRYAALTLLTCNTKLSRTEHSVPSTENLKSDDTLALSLDSSTVRAWCFHPAPQRKRALDIAGGLCWRSGTRNDGIRQTEPFFRCYLQWCGAVGATHRPLKLVVRRLAPAPHWPLLQWRLRRHTIYFFGASGAAPLNLMAGAAEDGVSPRPPPASAQGRRGGGGADPPWTG